MHCTLLLQIPYFTPEEIAALETYCQGRVQLDRHCFLIWQGQVEQRLYFVMSGTHLLPDVGHLLDFDSSNTLLVSLSSFLDSKPPTTTSRYSEKALVGKMEREVAAIQNPK